MLGLVLSGLLTGCETAARLQEPSWTREPIAEVATVAGRWEGLMTSAPRAHPWDADDWVRVMIGTDGSYEFASYRMIGVFSGKGTAVLEQGDLVSRSERGRIKATLLVAGNQRMLKVLGVTGEGMEYTAKLSPAK
jgi:hypothetical protein